MKLYHGSPVSGLETLEPKYDPRLGITGIFVSDEPYGPMLFSLIPESAKAEVRYRTEDGKFISGMVKVEELDAEGSLYTVDVPEGSIRRTKEGDPYLDRPSKPVHEERVTKEAILGIGWKVEGVVY